VPGPTRVSVSLSAWFSMLSSCLSLRATIGAERAHRLLGQ